MALKLLYPDEVNEQFRPYMDFNQQERRRLEGAFQRCCILVTCPICKRQAWKPVVRLRKNPRAIYCRSCSCVRLLAPEDVPEDLRPYIDFDSQRLEPCHDARNLHNLCITIYCKDCGAPRRVAARNLKRGVYQSGYCTHCKNKHIKRLGAANNKWGGGRHIGADGYVKISLTLIPESDYWLLSEGERHSRAAREHRYIAAKKVGRPLQKGEFVKHLNGCKHDNRPENLEIDTGVQNTMEHHDAVRRAKAAEGRVRELEDFLLGLGYDPKKVGISKQ